MFLAQSVSILNPAEKFVNIGRKNKLKVKILILAT